MPSGSLVPSCQRTTAARRAFSARPTSSTADCHTASSSSVLEIAELIRLVAISSSVCRCISIVTFFVNASASFSDELRGVHALTNVSNLCRSSDFCTFTRAIRYSIAVKTTFGSNVHTTSHALLRLSSSEMRLDASRPQKRGSITSMNGPVSIVWPGPSSRSVSLNKDCSAHLRSLHPELQQNKYVRREDDTSFERRAASRDGSPSRHRPSMIRADILFSITMSSK